GLLVPARARRAHLRRARRGAQAGGGAPGAARVRVLGVAQVNPDAPRAVRTGEELDLRLLGAWMGTPGPLSLEQFPRGHSNLTYLLRSGEREYVLRRPP